MPNQAPTAPSTPVTLPSEPVAPPVATTPAPTPEPAPASAPATPAPMAANEPPVPKSPTRNVPHDWKPKSLEDSLAQALGEINVAPDPNAPAAPTEPTTPEPPKPEPTAETTDAEIEAEVKSIKFSGEKERDAFRRAKFELREAKRRLKDLEGTKPEVEALKAKIAELEAAKATPPPAPSEDFKAKYEAADKELAAVRLEKSSIYQERIGQPLAAIEKAASDLAKRYSLDERKVLNALQDGTDERAALLSDLAADMKDFDKTKFYTMATDYEAFQSERTRLLENAKQHFESLSAQERAEQERAHAEFQKAWETALPQTWDKVSKAAGISPVEGQEDYNSKLEAASRFAATTKFSDLTVESQVEVMHRAAIQPFLLGRVSILEQQLAAKEAELGKFRTAQPGAGAGASSSPSSQPSKGTDFVKNIDAALAAAGFR